MPVPSKRHRIFEEVTSYHIQQKRARIRYMVSELLDDLESSESDSQSIIDTPSDSSDSSDSSMTSPSSASSDSDTPSSITHSEYSSSNSDSDSEDLDDDDSLNADLFGRWDAWMWALMGKIATTRVLETGPPVKKLGQLGLYLAYFRYDHPDRFRKKMRVSPPVFERLVELIENDDIFHNNSHVPQSPIPIQLAIFLVRLGHYGNASSPEYVAQWAGVSVGTVINATYRCLIAFLALHDEAVMMPPEEEKERAKEYVEVATCPEWRNGFLLADGTKFRLFQKPGLHGEAWFDKDKNYSIDCQVHGDLLTSGVR
jgi:hypothetical protein